MAINKIDVKMLSKMFLAGARGVEAQKDYINELNVFPVPDGDTGTNMSMTILAAAKEVANLENPTMDELGKAISSGSLRGARGNSGVILSQLLRGFTKVIRKEEEIDTFVLAAACARARDTAYKAVMKPKEGTILTVASGIAEKAAQLAEETDDLEVFFPAVLEYGREVLAKTPEMLPVLKEAGVVDSGGQGLIEILQGAYDAFLGKEVDYSSLVSERPSVDLGRTVPMEEVEIHFGYCTEFIVMSEAGFEKGTEEELKEFLSTIGDSIVCVADDDVIKIHVHTDNPGKALQKGLSFGQLSRIKIDNMREEHQEKLIRDASRIAREEEKRRKQAEKKPVGFIAVSIGDGLNTIFEELGVDYLIQGGQTMNPSTEDMLNAIEQVHAETIFILPNNKNIILAANQAKDLVTEKEIVVIPTKTVPQGITAVVSYDPEQDVETNKELMLEEIERVKTGQVTYAVRDTTIDEKEIKEGNIMGIGDEGILSVGVQVEETTMEMIEELVEEDSSLLTVYYGQEVSEEIAVQFAERLRERYKDIDVDVHFGGQPIYYYVVSVE